MLDVEVFCGVFEGRLWCFWGGFVVVMRRRDGGGMHAEARRRGEGRDWRRWGC
jgi:hypothetical protein